MKKYIKIAALFLTLIVSSFTYAQNEYVNNPIQYNNKGKAFLTFDWQVNLMVNDFVKNVSGWGANMETYYYFTDKIAAGAFVGWHTNNEHIMTKTYDYETESTTTDMFRGIFQLPFGVLFRYDFNPNKMISPYASMRVGTVYNEQSIFLYFVEIRNKKWNFYASPELGLNIFPTNNYRVGLNMGIYYAFSSNTINFKDIAKTNAYNNFGLRIGLTIKL